MLILSETERVVNKNVLDNLKQRGKEK